mmetsp:Transcript_20879/g.52759  ORF Transcript_20879/g.52759 Transcript_20879/m.52759 type:complete len:207 (+) Transcript_20879:43-663(+)
MRFVLFSSDGSFSCSATSEGTVRSFLCRCDWRWSSAAKRDAVHTIFTIVHVHMIMIIISLDFIFRWNSFIASFTTLTFGFRCLCHSNIWLAFTTQSLLPLGFLNFCGFSPTLDFAAARPVFAASSGAAGDGRFGRRSSFEAAPTFSSESRSNRNCTATGGFFFPDFDFVTLKILIGGLTACFCCWPLLLLINIDAWSRPPPFALSA